MWRPCKPTLVLLPLVAVALVALASLGPVLAHAAEVHLETVRAVAVAARYDTGPDPLQKGLMAASVIWGCIGTALYFRRRST